MAAARRRPPSRGPDAVPPPDGARFALRTLPAGAGGRSLAIEALAREAGLHPEVVGRLVRLGLVGPTGTAYRPSFPPDAAARLARAGRLRRDLGLNYAGAVLACDLLARIEELEARLRSR